MGKFIRGEIWIKERIEEEIVKNYIKEFLGGKYLCGVQETNNSFGSVNSHHIKISQYPLNFVHSPIILNYQLLEGDIKLFNKGIIELKENYAN